MIDVSHKIKTLRTAIAQAVLKLKPETVALMREGKIPKGNPLEVAKVAAIQAVKNTPSIIPYCHPLPVDFVGVEYTVNAGTIVVDVTVKAIYKTGVEMEALTGASVAALTLYDMMKMLDEEMEILGVKLLKKKGGKSDFKESFTATLRGAALVMSDSIASGAKDDLSGKLIVERMKKEGVEVVEYKIISDDVDGIVSEICRFADELHCDLIITTGGTGFSPRDNTPEAMRNIIEREIPGIPEAIRAYGQERTPYSMLSRSMSGIRGKSIIVNLPGSKKGVAESLDALFPSIFHAFKMLWGGKGWHE